MLKRSLSCSFVFALWALSGCGGGESPITIEPLAAGAGLYFTDGNTIFPDANANFYKLNPITGETAVQTVNTGSDDAGRCPSLFALDSRPDGVVLAVARRVAAIYEVDPRVTRCKLLAGLPEVMAAVAVRSDGHIFTVSVSNKLYELDSRGGVLFATTLVCPANAITCKILGIDFAPDGTLFGIGQLGQWGPIDTLSGRVTTIKSGAAFSDDFDIDALGKVRGLAGGELRNFDLAGNQVGTAITVFGGTAFATGLVYR